MPASNTINVLVTGAGPVGLFCANELNRHGISCRIIDKKECLSDKSKALGIHIRTLDVMQDCGLLDEVLAQGHRIKGIVFNAKGSPLVDLTFDDVGSNRDYLIDLPQDKTESILHQSLVNKGGQIEWQRELVKIKPGKNHIKATIKNQDGSEEIITANWIIACDGAHSTLRHLVKEEFSGSEYQQSWWLADLYIDWNHSQEKMMMYISDKGPLACFPMGDQRYRVVMTAPPGFEGEVTLDEIDKEFKSRSYEQFKLSNPIWITPFNIHHRQIQQYRHNRLFFAGDSAHIHSPMGGQGLNTGIQDIYNLVWKLALVEKGYAKTQILDSYHDERYPVGKNVLQKTDLMTRMILLQNPLAVGLRNLFIRCMTSIKPIRKYLTKDLAELTINYSKSPIVKAQGNGIGFKAGEFIGDFNLTPIQTRQPQAVQDITQGTDHHLLLFTGVSNHADIEEAARQISKELPWVKVHVVVGDDQSTTPDFSSIYKDEGNKIHQQFKLKDPTAILVRPDKYIGLIQSPLNASQLTSSIQALYN